jgi:hypothetical protein
MATVSGLPGCPALQPCKLADGAWCFAWRQMQQTSLDSLCTYTGILHKNPCRRDTLEALAAKRRDELFDRIYARFEALQAAHGLLLVEGTHEDGPVGG